LDKCQEVFEHGEMAKEKPDKTEQDGETQIVPKERVPKCPNSRRCMLGTYVFSELHKKSMLTEHMMHLQGGVSWCVCFWCCGYGVFDAGKLAQEFCGEGLLCGSCEQQC
jgi:hypothetical protein